MSVARRLQDQPVLLERAYKLTEALIWRLEPLLRRVGLSRLESTFVWGERISKGAIFDCRMCGMCTLRGSGMTCPMTCPKEIRNGPCGGVRQDGKCEVLPDMDCVWVLGWDRAANMKHYSEKMMLIHPPVDRRLQGTSAWLNMLDGRDSELPPHWPAEMDAGSAFNMLKLAQGTEIHEP